MRFISPVLAFQACILLLVLGLGCTLSGGAQESPTSIGAPVVVPVDPNATVIYGPPEAVDLLPFGLPDGLSTVTPGSRLVEGQVPVPGVEIIEPDNPVAVVVPVPSPGSMVVVAPPVPGATVVSKPNKAGDKFSEILGELLERPSREGVIESVGESMPSADVASLKQASVGARSGRGNFIPPEAGGLVNPNDALLPLVYFEGYGVNPFVDADEDPLSTFALDGDTASFEIAKLFLDEDRLPPEDSVRVEEWVNSFDQGYPEVESGLGLFLDGGPSPYGEDGYRLVRVGVGAAGLPEQRDPVNLIVVLDVSGSMSADSRIGVAKRLISGILDQVEASDRVALITYGDSVKVVQAFCGGNRDWRYQVCVP